MTSTPYLLERFAFGAHDFDRMYDLAIAAADDALHIVDLPWRLTSPSARQPERTRLWEDPEGRLVAWAVLQYPAWHCLDYVIHPAARTVELESGILGWACARLEAEAADRGSQMPFYVSAHRHDGARIAAIEQAGFLRANWGYVRLVRDLDKPISAPTVTQGFVVRSLAGEGEVDAYVAAHRAAFGSANMTVEWRRETLRDARYVPELDLVAIAPDGTLAGFCVCWMTPSETERRFAQVEPLGILPVFQRQGLGRALLLEGLKRARAFGAERMEVNAESDNDASQGAYGAAGFRPQYEMPFFFRQFG